MEGGAINSKMDIATAIEVVNHEAFIFWEFYIDIGHKLYPENDKGLLDFIKKINDYALKGINPTFETDKEKCDFDFIKAQIDFDFQDAVKIVSSHNARLQEIGGEYGS